VRSSHGLRRWILGLTAELNVVSRVAVARRAGRHADEMDTVATMNDIVAYQSAVSRTQC
jgi:hypothetical protein